MNSTKTEKNAASIYELNWMIAAHCQGDIIISEYYTKLRSYLHQLIHLDSKTFRCEKDVES